MKVRPSTECFELTPSLQDDGVNCQVKILLKRKRLNNGFDQNTKDAI
ncbi:MAG: hypothetical protein ABSB40_00015 [Nitrososphaeria archaeon]